MSKPTIVLVHGSFGDASSWRSVFDILDGDEYTVLAPANPLRGLANDASYLEGLIDQLDGPVLAEGQVLQPRPLPDGGAELSVDPERFHEVFTADLPDVDAAFMAHAQRPVSPAAFEEPATAAAWRAKPSWAVFGTGDLPVGPPLHRFQYDRAGSTVTEVEGASHFLMLSQPEIVAGVIRDAVTALTASAVA